MEQDKNIFSEEGRKNLLVFADTLQRVHLRLANEGYLIKGDKIYAPWQRLYYNEVSRRFEPR